MSADVGGATWSPLKDFANLFQQQGRLARDTDFNEFAAIVDRRLRAAAADLGSPGVAPGIQGTAVVPATTPDAFRISPTGPGGSDLAIGPGRLYVDGVVAENH